MAKSLYEQKVVPHLDVIEKWSRDGVTNEDIRKNLGIGKATWYKYVNEHSELSELLKKTREIVDASVENSLLKKALGYTVHVKKHFKVKKTEYKNGRKVKEEEEIKAVYDEVYIPPELGAQCFWLKNRRPEEWKDRKAVDGSYGEETENEVITIVKRMEEDDEGNMDTTANASEIHGETGV